mmetsp:Transcript_45629/g.146867  ORF Transcript_45629/g.146867 Transcript_45629/m.146867 type:complete len:298 (+) Transcript_45629:412-1305(+)
MFPRMASPPSRQKPNRLRTSTSSSFGLAGGASGGLPACPPSAPPREWPICLRKSTSLFGVGGGALGGLSTAAGLTSPSAAASSPRAWRGTPSRLSRVIDPICPVTSAHSSLSFPSTPTGRYASLKAAKDWPAVCAAAMLFLTSSSPCRCDASRLCIASSVDGDGIAASTSAVAAASLASASAPASASASASAAASASASGAATSVRKPPSPSRSPPMNVDRLYDCAGWVSRGADEVARSLLPAPSAGRAGGGGDAGGGGRLRGGRGVAGLCARDARFGERAAEASRAALRRGGGGRS